MVIPTIFVYPYSSNCLAQVWVWICWFRNADPKPWFCSSWEELQPSAAPALYLSVAWGSPISTFRISCTQTHTSWEGNGGARLHSGNRRQLKDCIPNWSKMQKRNWFNLSLSLTSPIIYCHSYILVCLICVTSVV